VVTLRIDRHISRLLPFAMPSALAPASLQSLPPEVLAQVASHLSYRDAQRLLSTSRAFHASSSDPDFWRAALRARAAPPSVRAGPSWVADPCYRFALVAAAQENWCYSALPRTSLVSGGGDEAVNVAPAACARFTGTVAVVDAGGLLRCWAPLTAGAVTGGGRGKYFSLRDTGRQVTAVGVDAGGGRIAVGGADKAVVVHDVAAIEKQTSHDQTKANPICTPTPIRGIGLTPGKMLRGHTGSVSCVAFVAGGAGFESCRESDDSYSACSSVEYLMDEEESIVASGGDDMTIRLHNTFTRRGLGVLRGHGSQVKLVEPVLRGRKLLSCGTSDLRVKLWDVDATACVATVRCMDPITAVAIDAHRGDTVYVSSGRAVKIVDLRDAVSTAAILSLPQTWCADYGPIQCLTLREDGMLAAGVGGGGVAIWDANGPWEARGLGWPGRGGHRESKRVRVVALTQDAALVGCANGRVSAVGLEGGHDEVVGPASFSKRGVSALIVGIGRSKRLLGVGRDDGSLDVLDVLSVDGVVVDWEKAARSCGLAKRIETREGTTASPFWRDRNALRARKTSEAVREPS
jgi:hypothetical protein